MTKISGPAAAATGVVLATLAAGQFVMALDTTVMNTAIATVAEDLDTTVTGRTIQAWTDKAVDPLGTSSRSITTGSTPASLAASAAQRPAAPAPMISSGTSLSKSTSSDGLTLVMAQR